MDAAPAFLALDWGTSSLRAYLMDEAGHYLESRHSDHGIQFLPLPGKSGFEAAFTAIAGDWLAAWPGLPVLAAGMVGSAQGWLEAPYVLCPAHMESLAARSVSLVTELGTSIRIVPGVMVDDAGKAPDVIRGEETQVAGVLNLFPELATGSALLVMPGTHSKWVLLENGCIRSFATHMTGELFALLKKHSILGRLMPATPSPDSEERDLAFEQGLSQAAASRPGDLGRLLFSVRTLGLTGRLHPSVLSDYLSGLMIGSELVSGLAEPEVGRRLFLVGDTKLCALYGRAFSFFHAPVQAVVDNPAPRGLLHIARSLGLAGSAS